MAKLVGPLHSLSASGSVGKMHGFRTTKAGAVCARVPSPYKQHTPNMLTNQQTMRDARSAFLSLSVMDLTRWQARATAIRLGLWQTFFTEYRYQRIAPPAMPLIPEPSLR